MDPAVLYGCYKYADKNRSKGDIRAGNIPNILVSDTHLNECFEVPIKMCKITSRGVGPRSLHEPSDMLFFEVYLENRWLVTFCLTPVASPSVWIPCLNITFYDPASKHKCGQRFLSLERSWNRKSLVKTFGDLLLMFDSMGIDQAWPLLTLRDCRTWMAEIWIHLIRLRCFNLNVTNQILGFQHNPNLTVLESVERSCEMVKYVCQFRYARKQKILDEAVQLHECYPAFPQHFMDYYLRWRKEITVSLLTTSNGLQVAGFAPKPKFDAETLRTPIHQYNVIDEHNGMEQIYPQTNLTCARLNEVGNVEDFQCV